MAVLDTTVLDLFGEVGDGWWAGNGMAEGANNNQIFPGGFTYGAFDYLDLNGWLQFDLPIPQGAQISEAHVICPCVETRSNTTVNCIISAVDVDDGYQGPWTRAGLEGAPRTTAQVEWNNIPAWTSGQNYNTPDIKDIIQEIVNRPGWQSGNRITILLEDNGSTQVSWTYRKFASRDSNPPGATLHVEYTAYTAKLAFKLVIS